ncbi:MAG: hypothetical protein OXF04_02855 [bacterium]|nr:hypothetical protein [bacterium]
MPVTRQIVSEQCLNPNVFLPYELRLHDFTSAMQDVYDFFFDVNSHLTGKGLGRLEDTLRKANLSGTLSDMTTASLAKHSRALTQNNYHNGHPDLIVKGRFPNDSVKSGEQGVEIKTPVKKGGAVDTHGARDQWLCIFVYMIDNKTEPAIDRLALKFTEVYLSHVQTDDFRKNERGELGTRTATPHKEGMEKIRKNWVYLDPASEEGS